jgi:hypothetical protein
MMPSYFGEDFKSLRDEVRGESRLLRDQLLETNRMLANHLQEDARTRAQMCPGRDMHKAMFDRCIRIASLVVDAGKLIALLWKTFR